MKKILKKILSLSVSALICASVITGCTFPGSGNGDEEEEKIKVDVIGKAAGQDFWLTCKEGAFDAGKELGIDVSFQTPENESQVDKQIKMVKDDIENGVDAIVLAPLDKKKLNKVIDEAKEKGIPVLTVDSDVTSRSRAAIIGTDNRSAGAIAARNAAAMINEKGTIAVMCHVKGAQTTIERRDGFLDEIKKNHKNIKISDIRYCGGNADKAFRKTKKMIEENTGLDCIYATNEGAATGAARAVDELGLKNEISLIGFDSSTTEIKFLKEGVVDGMMVQNPYNMGYLGVRNIIKVLKGREIDKELDTGAMFVDRENLDDEDTQWLLYPLGK